jgi:hypothetical protein
MPLARNFPPHTAGQYKFDGNLMHFLIVLKMVWNDRNVIPNMLTTSWLTVFLFLRKSSFTCSTFSPVLYVDGCPKHLTSSKESHYFWTWKSNQKPVFIMCSRIATFNISKLSLVFLPIWSKIWVDTACLRVCHFLSMPKLQTGNTYLTRHDLTIIHAIAI